MFVCSLSFDGNNLDYKILSPCPNTTGSLAEPQLSKGLSLIRLIPNRRYRLLSYPI